MRNRKRKSGFTLVELVIVIAVIAILAGTLIPTFVGIIQKARTSVDTQLANNMNKELVHFKLNYAGENLTASDIRYYLERSSLEPSNSVNESFWFDLTTLSVVVSKAENLEPHIQAEYINKANILEEIVPGYLLLDTGKTPLGQMIYGLRNLKSADEYNQIMSNIRGYSGKLNNLNITKEQYDNMVSHLENFSLDRTIYVNEFTYITTAFNKRNVVVDNVVFSDQIKSMPNMANSFIDEVILENSFDSSFSDGEDNVDRNRIGVTVRYNITVPYSLKVIQQNNLFWYITSYNDLDTKVEFLSDDIKIEGSAENYENHLFSEYLMNRNKEIEKFNVDARAKAIAQTTFEIATEEAVQKIDKDGNIYSEVSLRVTIPQVVYRDKDKNFIDKNGKILNGIPDSVYSINRQGDYLDINGEVVLKFNSASGDYTDKNGNIVVKNTGTGDNKNQGLRLYNDFITDQKYRYTTLSNGNTRVDVKIYDEYGVLYEGTISYPPEIRVNNFKFNAGILSFSTPISNDTQLSNNQRLLNENEILVYKIYINGKLIAELDSNDYFTGNALADYVLDDTDNAETCMLFLVVNDNYTIYDNNGNYCIYNVNTEKFIWYNSKNEQISSIATPSEQNIGNYYIMKTVSYSESAGNTTTFVEETSKINIVENSNGERVLNEFYYNSVTEVTEKMVGEYITTEITETHNGEERYIYPRLIPLEYLTKNLDPETNQNYYTMDAKLELIIRNTETNKDVIVCSNNSIFGSSKNSLKTYYMSSLVNKTDRAKYNYSFTFKNPLYYTVDEKNAEHMELLAFTDKSVITFTRDASLENTYRFKIRGTGVNEGKGITTLYGDDSKPTKDYFDCTYQISYTYNPIYEMVIIEILGLDNFYTIYGNELFNTFTYTQRIPYKYAVSKKLLEDKAGTTYSLSRFNGKIPEKIGENAYSATIYESEDFNPLTTQFIITENGKEIMVNAEAFGYEVLPSDNDEYDLIYRFYITSNVHIDVYCGVRDIVLKVDFLHTEIGSSIVITKKNDLARMDSNYIFNNDSVENAEIICSFNEEIILSVNKDFDLDNKYGFVAWYSINEDNVKELISTSETTTYNIPGENVKIMCEFATNPLNNDVFLFTYGSDNTCKISWCNDKTIEEVYIPTYSGNYLVTGIEANVFNGAKNLSKIYIPDTVTSISESSFAGTSIDFETETVIFGNYFYTYNDSIDTNTGKPVTSYTLPDNIVTIGERAFAGNENLREIYIPSSVTKMGASVFEGMANLEYVYFESDSMLTEIGAYTFRNCLNFKGIVVDGVVGTFPSKVTKIGNYAFSFCKSIETIDFANVETLGTYCFNYCVLLDNVSFEGTKITTIPSNCFANCITLSNLTLSSNITSIVAAAFTGCSGLTSISLEEANLTALTSMFTNCTSLLEIYLPAGLTEIPASVFSGCTSLQNIFVGGKPIDFTTIKSIGANAFNNCYSYDFGNITIGKVGVAISIGEKAFYNCYGLTGITFKGSWSSKELPGSVFYGCVNLETASLNGATGLGSSFFYNCSALTKVDGFNSNQINDSVFYGCLNLKTTSITYSNLISIGAQAFYNCQSLEFGNLKLGNGNNNITLGYDAFYSNNGLTSVTINANKVEIRSAANGATVAMFYACTKVTSITINCNQLYFIGVGNGSTVGKARASLTGNGFVNGCTTLQTLALNVMEMAFWQYTPATDEYVLSSDGHDILPYRFAYNCANLTTVVLPYNVTGFGNDNLQTASKLANITKYYVDGYVSDIVTSEDEIEFTVLGNANTLKSSSFASAILDNGFLLNKDGTTVYAYLGTGKDILLPETVTIINARAFDSAKLIKILTIDSTLSEIQDNAFRNSGFEAIVFNQPAIPEIIAGTAFSGINSEVSIIVPENLTDIYRSHSAFASLHINNSLEYELIVSSSGELTGYKGYPTRLVLPENVRSIKNGVFENYERLISVEMTNVVTIGENSFKGCINLTNVIFNSGVTTIKQGAFEGCSKLTFELPSDVQIVGDRAFKGTNVTSITIHSSIKTIGESSFDIVSLTRIYAQQKIIPPTIGTNAFGTNSELLIYIDKTSMTDYQTKWSEYASKLRYEDQIVVNIKDGILNSYSGKETILDLRGYEITQIGESAFAGNTILTNITFPKTITTIGANAFNGCTKLKTITFSTISEESDTDIISIGASAFYNCTELQNIGGLDMSKITSFGESAFYNCKKLDYDNITLTLDITVANYPANLFQNCASIRQVTFEPKTATKTSTTLALSVNLFNGCTALKKVILPAVYKNLTLNNSVFQNCKSLETIENLNLVFSGKVGTNVFNGCQVLDFGETITLASGHVNTSMFTGCNNLKNVVLTGTTAGLPATIFKNCTGLLTVAIQPVTTGKATIGANAFEGCINLVSVYMNGNSPVANAIVLSNVTTVNATAFKNCDNITKVVIENNADVLCTINATAFAEMDNLTTVEFNTQTKFNATNIFQNCPKLDNVDLTNITAFNSSGVFAGCIGLKTVTFSGTEIPNYALINASYVTTVHAENVTTIGISSFSACTNLATLYIDFKKVTSIGNNAFANCMNLKFADYTFGVDGKVINTNTTKVIFGNAGETLTFGTTVFTNAFRTTSNLKTVEIRGTVLNNTIPASLFLNASNIEEILFNTDSMITSIGGSAFSGCTALKTIGGTGFDLSQIESFGATVFSNCKVLDFGKDITISATDITASIFPANYEIDKIRFTNMSVIPANLFSGWYNLKVAQFDQTITSIGDAAFKNCANLTKIIDASGNSINLRNLTLLGKESFYGCKKLVLSDNGTDGKVVISAGCSITAGGNQFYNNYNLTQVEILSASLTEIYTYMFYACINLKTISIPSGINTIGAYAFNNCVNLEYIYDSSTGEYFDYSKLTSLGNYGFTGCISLKYNDNGNVDMSGVTTLGTYVFQNNLQLKSIDVSKVTALGNYVFSYCMNLEKVIINQKLLTIGTNSFEYCQLLEGLYYTDGSKSDLSTVTSIGNYAFQYNYMLTNDLILTSVSTLGTYAFYKNTQIKLLDLSANTALKVINNYDFYQCENLEIVKLSKNITTINTYGFTNCYNLSSIAYSDEDNLSRITSIGTYAFQNCQSLTSVTFANGLKTISDYSFQNCVNLVNITFESLDNSGCSSIGKYTFYGCIKLRTIDLPSSMTNIGANSFERCTIMYAINMHYTEAGKGLIINSNALNNSPKIYFTFLTAELTEAYKSSVATFASRFYSVDTFDSNALEYGFVISNNRIVAYNGTGNYKYIKIYNDRIMFKSSEDEEYTTLEIDILAVLNYCFTYLEDMKELYVDETVALYSNWSYRNTFA